VAADLTAVAADGTKLACGRVPGSL